MGIIRSKLMRPLKTFNIANRTQKIINQEKPTVAPYYPSVYEQIKVAKEVSPNFMKEHYKKDTELYDRLKGVFLTSDKTDNPQIERKEDILPFSTTTPDPFEFGFWEPANIPEKKCHLRNVIVILTDYYTNKKENTAEKLAEKYKLDLQDVENLLEYYRVLQIFKPSEREHGFRESSLGLPAMDFIENSQWTVSEKLEKFKAEDDKRQAQINKEEEIEKRNKSESSEMDKQTESSHGDKETVSSPHRDKEVESLKNK